MPPTCVPKILIVSLTAYPLPLAFLVTAYVVPLVVILNVALEPELITLVPTIAVYVFAVSDHLIPLFSLDQ